MNMKPTSVKFNHDLNKEFTKTLKSRVNEYFIKKNVDKHGNLNMVFKSIFMFALFFVPYFLIMTETVTSTFPVLALWGVIGTGMAGIGLSIMHDANHGAYSKFPIVNKVMGLSMDLVGGSARLWKLQHNVLHHTYTNVAGVDEDVEGPPILRFTPHHEHMKIHKYQHIFFPFLYGLMTFGWIIWKDFLQVFRFNRKGLISDKELKKDVLTIIAWKAFYFGYILIVPIFVLDLPTGTTLLGFLILHFVCGLILSFIFQLAHVMPNVDFPLPNDESIIESNWAIHQLRTTANFSQKSRLFSWYVGGLNYQVEHHLFSGICHVHYRHISKIIKATAEEFKVPYHAHGSFIKAVGAHYKLIRAFGRTPS